jgi:NADPH-dependent 2,4-dienoyl-CoA reductase/sulfur reductase-like enzyme
MNKSKYLILGGGMVAGYAAKELAEHGLKPGELAVLSADTSLPYERPPLSKSFLAGKEVEANLRINPESFYQEKEIAVRLGCEIRAVDVKRRVVALAGGDEWAFDKLIVATGANPNRLNLPGADLPGVYYLRSLDDSKRIQDHAANAKRAVVIGGGFIAMEVASVLAQKGIPTTMLIRQDRVWKQFFTPEMSRFFETYYTKRGVEFIKQASVTALQGAGTIASVRLEDHRTVPCDLIVAGIGVRPAVYCLSGSGINVSDGVLVDEYLQTNHPDIYAAGDVAHYYDTLFAKRRRVEHWDNAVSQGQHCARALAGDRAPFVHVPYFFSDIFDLSYEFWGDSVSADEIVHRGDWDSASFSVWWLARGQVVAVFAMNRPDEEREAAPRWIASHQAVSAAELRKAPSVADLARAPVK